MKTRVNFGPIRSVADAGYYRDAADEVPPLLRPLIQDHLDRLAGLIDTCDALGVSVEASIGLEFNT